MTSTCARCSSPLPQRLAGGRATVYCGGACRVAAHRARRARRRLELLQAEELTATVAVDVPADLAAGTRWLRWRRVVRNGRTTKMPVTITGATASSTDPATWSSYADAAASSVGDGLGVVLLEADDIVCVDLDHVLVDGQLLPAAAWLFERLPRTWVEVSPSGDGLHVFGRAASLRAGRRFVTLDGVSLEAYPHGRYMTVTGQRFGDSPLELADIDDVLADLLAR